MTSDPLADQPSYEELAARLAVAEQTIAAIKDGEVDALVVGGPDGPQVYTLEGAEAFYRVLIEQMPVGAATVTVGGAILYANGTFATMLDVPLPSLIGGDLHALARDADHGPLRQLLAGELKTADITLRGRRRDVEVGFSVEPVAHPEADALCLVAVDLTDRRLVEAELREARARAEQANVAKNAFLSQMSHELRTPLHVILGFCQLLEADGLAPEHQMQVSSIASSGVLLLELITDVLEFSRIESGDVHVELETLSLAEIVEEVVRELGPLADERAVTVAATWAPGAPRPFVRADRRRVRQILLNLVTNAIKYNHAGGAVTLTAALTPDGRCHLRVVDTGPGISSFDRERVFVPFERIGAERHGIEGTGLGLAVSRSLATAMGGRLTVDEGSADGASFLLDLPGAAAPRAAGGPATPDDSVPLGVSESARGTVLYIEDSVPNAQLMRAILRRRPNVTLLIAGTAADGLRDALEHRPALILLDRQLPDESGDRVLERLLADPRSADIPVVVATANADRDDAARLIAAGALDYVTKPMDIANLLTLIDRHCTGAPG